MTDIATALGASLGLHSKLMDSAASASRRPSIKASQANRAINWETHSASHTYGMLTVPYMTRLWQIFAYLSVHLSVPCRHFASFHYKTMRLSFNFALIEIEILIEILHLNYVTDKANKAAKANNNKRSREREICHSMAYHAVPCRASCHISGSSRATAIGSSFINKVQRVLDAGISCIYVLAIKCKW